MRPTVLPTDHHHRVWPDLAADELSLLADLGDVAEADPAVVEEVLLFPIEYLLVHEGDVRVIDFDDCGFGWFLYDAATAVSFIEHRPDVDELMQAWLEGYRRVGAVSAVEENELWTFIMLRRMNLFAWIGSHSTTELARTGSVHLHTGAGGRR